MASVANNGNSAAAAIATATSAAADSSASSQRDRMHANIVDRMCAAVGATEQRPCGDAEREALRRAVAELDQRDERMERAKMEYIRRAKAMRIQQHLLEMQQLQQQQQHQHLQHQHQLQHQQQQHMYQYQAHQAQHAMPMRILLDRNVPAHPDAVMAYKKHQSSTYQNTVRALDFKADASQPDEANKENGPNIPTAAAAVRPLRSLSLLVSQRRNELAAPKPSSAKAAGAAAELASPEASVEAAPAVGKASSSVIRYDRNELLALNSALLMPMSFNDDNIVVNGSPTAVFRQWPQLMMSPWRPRRGQLGY